MFKLPKIQGTKCPTNQQYVIYFSCDYDYFDRHGFALQQSINRTVSWVQVHCHIINEGNIDHEVLSSIQARYNFTYTWEDVNLDFYKNIPKNKIRMKEGMDIFKTKDLDFIARRTYLASTRFMQCAKLFPSENQNILQIDCDSILRNGFHMSDFQVITNTPAVMPKPKDTGVFIASALSFGRGPEGTLFKNRLSQRMIQEFEKGCYWFVDQDILKKVVLDWRAEERSIQNIGYKWNAWGIKKDDVFSTGKGNKKETLKFKRAQYKWLPHHWQQKLKKEVLGV